MSDEIIEPADIHVNRGSMDSASSQLKHYNAVETKDLLFAYGNKLDPVLKSISINVREGTIYGLLGPSGCGKTSLLRCLLGQLKPSSGTILVLGHKPGSADALVPGPGAGFMPQEVALYEEFTVKETVYYFGKLYGMSQGAVRDRADFLLGFLRLNNFSSQLIRTLSGGQKRRVSLASALVHSPPLLILDEPTVGVDPLLRETIWDYLVDLAKNERMTIMITTHYIEEARRADTVALLRDGHLMAEANPDSLITQHGLASLEMVFLKICQHADGVEDAIVGTTNGKEVVIQPADQPENTFSSGHRSSLPKPQGVKASLNRTSTLMEKSPAFEIVIFCLCIGRQPSGLKVAVYNPDSNVALNYSQQFLSEIETQDLHLVYYDSQAEAIEAVKKSYQWAALVFGSNYSTALDQRIQNPITPSNETVRDSTVYLYADMTEYPIQVTIMESLQSAASQFVSNLVDASQSFIKPSPAAMTSLGFLLGITYILAVGHTALSFVVERKDGLMERSNVAGVKSYEYLISHLIIQLLITIAQTFFLLLFVFFVFDIKLNGSLVLVVIMVISQGVTGMSFGYLISALCYDEQTAMMIAMGAFYPNLMLSGMVWPLEGMPPVLRSIAYFLPQTYAIESIRSIVGRGLPLTAWQVYYGFLSTGAWMVFFNVSAVLIFAYKQR
ncbi:ABC transporter G family member 20 [Halotydeus destructor]|nr:ABC transporter G family member 20 [Halotydeus destructor]